MSLRGRKAGSGPVSGPPEQRIQPPEACPDREAPVPSADVLRGISSLEAPLARQLEEALTRRIADKELRDALAAHNFSGPQYRRFQEELARYGTSVLRAWMYSGYVFELIAARGFHLHPTDAELEELHRNTEVREDLANMTVGVALPRFREHALLGGGWKYEGGASLPTYFMGSCLYVFPNEFRSRRVQQERLRRQDGRDPAITMQEAEPGLRPGGDRDRQASGPGPPQRHRAAGKENSRDDGRWLQPGGDRRADRRAIGPGGGGRPVPVAHSVSRPDARR